ncbi:hypothetical protein BJ138DRAFT_1228277 [Hygrophoropsis aurantiaca]|uniref:Uncharacterized protein n=1 Tax=Hygrophoropsis aurantiaca TaxID=72124 RepID=A0ACB8AHQ5_9AGAM|nr:hypothetical protein BJ138DRAFT_1228277 [Hygrophoropsis aurantiaca]
MAPRQPYQGNSRKLVLAFDVGTTYSGISYCILDPGDIPVIQGVTRFPCQENVGGDSKIPSIIYYDQEETVRAVGGEALQESTIEKAEDEGWTKLEWWKLHLRPRNMASSHVSDEDIPPLPSNKTAIQVLGDFMKYLYQCAKTYIEETHASGSDLWRSVQNNTEFILSHPNGWEGPQQAQIRRAAILAGLVPDTTEGHGKIQLVTEGEASLHFCLGSGLAADALKSDQGVIVVDAGGGTIDLSAYYMTISPPSLEEIAPAECYLQGSIFVSRRAREFLEAQLNGSKFGNKEDITQMTGEFDRTAKLRFSNAQEPSYIRFGTVRDKDPAFNIRSGQLKLAGTDVATLFEPSVKAIIDAVEIQRQTASKEIRIVFLVGGFAASNWLFAKLQAHMQTIGVEFCRPDSHTSKAVADGAIAFYLDHRVNARVSKFTYGTRCAIEYEEKDTQHKLRAHTIIPRPSGRRVIPNAFSSILTKGTKISESKEFRKDFITEGAQKSTCDSIATEIVCYRGDDTNPRWADTEPGMFSTLCTVHADTSQVSKTIGPRKGYGGVQFYRQEFSIILKFGLTELQAQISWMENGKECRGPATVVFEQVVEPA